jgi:hypothetical protein
MFKFDFTVVDLFILNIVQVMLCRNQTWSHLIKKWCVANVTKMQPEFSSKKGRKAFAFEGQYQILNIKRNCFYIIQLETGNL